MSLISPNAFLLGEPQPALTPDERMRHTTDLNSAIKLFRGNLYEHFEPTTEMSVMDGAEMRVFQWTGRTYVAE